MIENKNSSDFLNEFHWLMDVVHNIDVGLVVLDLELNVKLWNSFMQNHSAIDSSRVMECSIFDVFPELPESWFRRKVQTVTVLRNASFTTWEERPYLFRFRNYRPVTGIAEFMYQNCTLLPLTSAHGEVGHVCLIVYDVTEVATNRMQLQLANEQLQMISRTDGLTGLLNRKAWETALVQEFRRYQRHRQKCSLIMLDIDHFKPINDTYGHTAGDEVIRQTSDIILSTIRDVDIAGRYGGEEFVVILLDTLTPGASLVAERLRAAIERTRVIHDNQTLTYTISVGIAELTMTVKSATAWIEQADQALYQAKNAGRNTCAAYNGNSQRNQGGLPGRKDSGQSG